MSDSDLEEIKLDIDFNTVRKTSPSCSSTSARSCMGDTFREMKQANVVSLAKEANNQSTQKVKEETSVTGTSRNNQRRLYSAPCQKIRQSSGKLLRNISSAKPKYFYSNSKCSTDNLVHTNHCQKGSAIFDPISFHTITGVSSDKNGFSSLMKNLEPISVREVPSGESCKNNVYDMHVNNKQMGIAEMSQCMFLPSLKTKNFVDRDSNVPTEASSYFSSEESSTPFESSVFRESRLKCKRRKHAFTEKLDVNFHLHKSAQMEPQKNISPRYRQREYKTATSSCYKATDMYKIPFTVVHCGTQTDISFFTSSGTQIFGSVPNRSVSNPWFMLHKATNTSNENCSSKETSNELLSTTNTSFLHLKIHENDEVTSNGSSRNKLHKNSCNNTIEKCDQNLNRPCCGNGCFSRLFCCCF